MKRPEEILLELRDAIERIASGEQAPDKGEIDSLVKQYDMISAEFTENRQDSNYLKELLYRYNCENFSFYSSLYLHREGVLRRLASFGNRELTKAIAPILKKQLEADKMHLFPLTINQNTFTLHVLTTAITPSVAVLFCAISSSSFFSLGTHEKYCDNFVSLLTAQLFTPCDEEYLIRQIIEAGESGKYRSCLLSNCQSITEIFSHYGSAKLFEIGSHIRDHLKQQYQGAAVFEFSIGIFLLFFREVPPKQRTLLSYNNVPIPARYKEGSLRDFETDDDYYEFLTMQ